MTLDDVYGSDLDKFPLEQEAANWDADDLGLTWDETEVERIAQQFGSRGLTCTEPAPVSESRPPRRLFFRPWLTLGPPA
jgi:hypothetical protein